MFCKSTWRINSSNIQKLTFLLMTHITLNYIIWRGSHISLSWFLRILYTSPFGSWRWGNPGVPREKPSQQGENQLQTQLITYGTGWNQTGATLTVGKRSNYWAIPPPFIVTFMIHMIDYFSRKLCCTIINQSLLTLCSWVPIRQTALKVGHHLLNSDIQLANVDFGTITRWGPDISLKCFM